MKTSIRYRCWVAAWLMIGALGFTGTVAAQEEEAPLPEGDECVTCHVDFGELPDDFARYDVHLQAGLSCAGCHGGDATVDDFDLAKAPETGFIGIPSKQDIPQLCGRCHADPAFMRDYQPRIHTDQLELYYVSVHGQRLQEGDDKVADCASCHTAHSILPALDARSTVHPLNVPETCQTCHGNAEYMQAYPIPTNQFSEFANSVHGKKLLEDHDIGAPACNDCHGNHGATPPGVTSLRQVCGTCHPNNEQYFLESAMAEPFEAADLHACIECHGDHGVSQTSDAMVGIGDESVCMDCHGEGEEAYDVARKIHIDLSVLVTTIDSARVKQQVVERIGMNDVDIAYLLQNAHQNLVHARTLVHTFDTPRVAEKTGAGLIDAYSALNLALEQIGEYRTRRVGFGLATLFITILAIGLYLKIREIDKT